MAEINFYLRNNTPNKETGILLYFSYNGTRLNICTVDRIDPKYWDSSNQKARQSKSFPTNAEFNTRLNNIKNKVQDIYRKYLNDNSQQQPLPATIKSLIMAGLFDQAEPLTNTSYTLISFAEHYINQIETNKRLSKTGKPLADSTKRIHKTHLAILKEFQATRRKPITFEDVTLDFYNDFKDHLTTVRKYSTNSIGKHIRTLKGILSDATETGKNTKLDFRSKRFLAPTEEVDNVYLNPTELTILYNYDLSQTPRLERVRDLFLVGCWTGLRFSDFNSISSKNIKDRYINIKTQKTGKEVVIPVHPTVSEIIKRYDGKTENSLPLPISNQKMNDYLKEIGKLVGFTEIIKRERTKAGKGVVINIPKFKHLTTHTARRSFATNAYNMGVPTLTIMAITGHKTETSFMKYIKVTPTEHASKLLAIWNDQPKLKIVS
ncbi:site-specific integrase [Mucilaginibacter polytrichastri]|nr:site-specific integrase [Mucilaginibacter polytrichastri]